jgi:hypothetical protein
MLSEDTHKNTCEFSCKLSDCNQNWSSSIDVIFVNIKGPGDLFRVLGVVISEDTEGRKEGRKEGRTSRQILIGTP